MSKFNRDVELAKIGNELKKIKELQDRGLYQVVQSVHNIKFVIDRKKLTT